MSKERMAYKGKTKDKWFFQGLDTTYYSTDVPQPQHEKGDEAFVSKGKRHKALKVVWV